MKNLLIIFFILITNLVYSQVKDTYFKISGYKLGEYKEKPDDYVMNKRFKKTNLIISLHGDRFKIHSNPPKEFFFYQFVGEYKTEIDKKLVFVCVDSDGKICYLTIHETKKKQYIHIQYQKNSILFRIEYL